MVKITAKVQGMMCGMCEAHVNDAVRKELPVRKVTASHTQGQVVILAENEIDPEQVKKVISATGYTVLDVKSEPYEKKGLFSFFRK